MKKIFSTLCMALVAVAMMAQAPVITFEKTEHDFGKINEDGGRVSVVFNFTNNGMTPLVLSNVKASCGCTTPTWTKEPVEPGKSGAITVTYNPNGRPGRFQKTVTITSNASEATTRVYIKGEVIPKQAKPVEQFNLPVGALSMKSKTLDLGTIKKGEAKHGELEYKNSSKEEHSVDLNPNPASNQYLATQVTLSKAKANEVGKFIFEINTANTKLYGPVETTAYVVVDGKVDKAEAYKLTIKANIVEDFSQMTTEQKQQAPIIEVMKEYDLGKIAAGKNHKFVIPVKNNGVTALEIHRAYCNNGDATAKTPRAIKSGKKGAVTVDINTKGLKPGKYDYNIVLISNDYKNANKTVKLSFEVE